jgi:hypothetical protein
MNLPSTPDAKFQHPMKRPKVNIHTAFCHVHPFKSPIRLPEDPPSAPASNDAADTNGPE